MVIAILGLGTIGSGVLKIAGEHPGFEVRKVLEKRFVTELTTQRLEDITEDPEITAVVETMGGLHPAYEFAVQVMNAGKNFITANKLLVSAYGMELTRLAHEKGVAFLYSAACGGGIPYLSNLRTAHANDSIEALGGIFNGTTNFILDAMQTRGDNYDETLRTAQELGYAERDPSSDVEGLDTMRKVVLACAVGFDAFVNPEEIPVLGISRISAMDVAWAKERGLSIRLCARAAKQADGSICAYVEPSLLGAGNPETAICKNINYTWYEGKFCGRMSYSGQGAGSLPTASNIIRDLAHIDNGERYMTTDSLAPAPCKADAEQHPYYLRLAPGTDVPAEWIAQENVRDGWRQIVTNPVRVSDLHAFVRSASEPVFAAGISD